MLCKGKKIADDSSSLHFTRAFINKLVCPSYRHKLCRAPPLRYLHPLPFIQLDKVFAVAFAGLSMFLFLCLSFLLGHFS